MADTKTFKDIDKRLQKLVDETKENFKITKRWQAKLDDHALNLMEKVEADRKPRAKVQKEMLRVLETQETQNKVRARDSLLADFKMGKATLAELKAAKLSKQDFVKSGFGAIGSNIEMMKQWWQDGIGSFSQTVKQWWKNVKENSKVLQAAKRFWNSEAIKKAREFANQIGGIIKGHMSEILGEFQEVCELFKRFFGVVWDTVKSTFSGLFGGNKEAQKEKREEKMENHLKKIKEGIGFLVKGEKLDDISSIKKGKSGLMSKILDFFGLGGLLVGGAGALIAGLKVALIGIATKFILDSIKSAIEGYKKGDLGLASENFLVKITAIPRKIIGWVGKQILDYFDLDGESFQQSLSDENTRSFIQKMNKTIQKFMDDVSNFVENIFFTVKDGIATYWNSIVPFDWMKVIVGNKETVSKSFAQAAKSSEIAKNFKENDMGASNILIKTEQAIKDIKRTQAENTAAVKRGEGGIPVKELIKMNQNLGRLLDQQKEAQVQIQNQSNTVQGDNTGAPAVVDPDLLNSVFGGIGGS